MGAARERAPRVPPAPQPVAARTGVATIAALVPDLFFASKVEAMLAAAGHDVVAVSSPDDDRLSEADALVVDIDSVEPEAGGGLPVPVLGFCRHTALERRRRAEEAGLDLVVPRSRLARELPELVTRLLV